jgi:hypothetical protein
MPTRDFKSRTSVDDAWESIMDIKGGSGSSYRTDSNGFTKLSTNFYLLDGEVSEVVFLEDSPRVFTGHNLKMRSKNGKTFYVVEQCQKAVQKHCGFCTTNLKTVGDSRQFISFLLLDSRGSWDIENKKFDGKPAPKFWLAPLGAAKAVKRLRDEVGGTLLGKVVKLSKDSKNYTPQVITVASKKDPQARVYKAAPEYLGNVPDFEFIYQPLEDDEVSKILNYQNFEDTDEEEQRVGKF